MRQEQVYGELHEALKTIVSYLSEEWNKRNNRATPSGVLSGIGFDQIDPYLITYGFIVRGLIERRNRKTYLTRVGEEALNRIIEIAEIIREDSLFPDLDRGKILGATLYALYDWQNSYRTGEEYLQYLEKIKAKILEIKKTSEEKFKLLAVLLPRKKLDEGYTLEKLLEGVLHLET